MSARTRFLLTLAAVYAMWLLLLVVVAAIVIHGTPDWGLW